MALHANSCLILFDRRISDASEKFSNALSIVSSRIGLNITKGLSVYATNLKAVLAVGLVRHNNIVSKASVGFRRQFTVCFDSRSRETMTRRTARIDGKHSIRVTLVLLVKLGKL